jgi:hypothetical protein
VTRHLLLTTCTIAAAAPHSTLYRAVVPDAPDSEAAASAHQDWALDAHTLPPAVACEGMPLANFYRALFGIADVWTVGCSEREYVTFLTILVQRVLALGFGAPQADADCSVPVSPNGLVTVSVNGFRHPDLIRALWIQPGAEAAAETAAAVTAAAASAAAAADADATDIVAAAVTTTAGESTTDSGASLTPLNVNSGASLCESAAESMPSLCVEDMSVLEYDGNSSDVAVQYMATAATTAGATAGAGAGALFTLDGSSSQQQQQRKQQQQQADGSMVSLREFTAQAFATQPADGAAFMLFW